MKLLSTILLSLCVVSLAIGVHQLYYYDVQEVYWILSLSVLLFLLYTWVNSKILQKEKATKKEENTNKTKPKKQPLDKESSNYTPPKKKRKKRN